MNANDTLYSTILISMIFAILNAWNYKDFKFLKIENQLLSNENTALKSESAAIKTENESLKVKIQEYEQARAGSDNRTNSR